MTPKRKTKLKPKAKRRAKWLPAVTQSSAGGRPTDYRQEFCDQLVEHMSKGFSFTTFGAKINVHRDTLYEWMKVHTEFSDARKIGQQHFLMFWEQLSIDASQGARSSPANIIFMLKVAGKDEGFNNDIPFFGDKKVAVSFTMEDA